MRVLFLDTDPCKENRQVYYSKYETCNVENVDCYKRSVHVWGRLTLVLIIEDLEIRTITFHKMELEDIVQINSDKKDNFSAIDSKRNCYRIRFRDVQ